ncbi:S9 family peptidase [Variovorax sp. J22G73]|uniref:S9 family peptidase n=1 Tax=unclassified Variovorax TaxID=663243 RepID=UPI00257901E3|nr:MULTISPECIES: S9 family peptidase [unclassified Variovorax]MDM0003546.1 S9 family peptidase [Variovorax sp. J22R203]MDM0096788.1 S9 family peptidase [Variovorax sp. J22G73]
MHIAHRRIFCSATLWAAGLGTSFAAEPTATPIPLHAFAELPAIEQPQLSPDGRGAVMVQTIDGKSYVVVSGFGEKPRIVLKSDGDKYTIGMVRWAGNRRVLVGARFQEDRRGVRTFESRLIAVDRDGGNLKGDLTLGIQQGKAFERARRVPQFQDRIVGALPDEPETVLIALDASAPGQPDVYRLDTRTGRSRLVQRNLGGIRQWMADAQGEVRLGYGVTRTVLRVMVRPPAAPAENKSENKDEIGSGSGSWRPLMSYEGTDPAEARRLALRPLGFDADPRCLYALAPVGGRDALVRIDLQDPAFPRETLLANARFDVRGELLREPRTRRVVGFDYRTDVSRIVYWNDAARQRQEALDRALPQRGNRIVSDDEAGQQSIVLSVAGSRPPQYFTMNWTNRQLVRLADTHPSLEGLPLSTPKRIALTSRDGLALEGYLTLPPAREANAKDHVKAVPLPTVLLPHGGPASADTGRYDYWAQFLASRGWAVLQLNFRGSIGYGQDFREAGRKRWGLEMQDDLADGLRWLIDQGIADARRVCIVGGSYGGYAALMGAVKDPALYRCVVSFAGPSDLHDLLSFSQRFMDYELGAEAQIGTWWGDRDKLRQTSPALRAGEIKVPVLLIHGAQDAVVPVEQSRDMAEALKKAGHSDTRYVELPLGDHTLSREEDRVRVMTELETFLKKNLDENTDAQATRGM